MPQNTQAANIPETPNTPGSDQQSAPVTPEASLEPMVADLSKEKNEQYRQAHKSFIRKYSTSKQFGTQQDFEQYFTEFKGEDEKLSEMYRDSKRKSGSKQRQAMKRLFDERESCTANKRIELGGECKRLYLPEIEAAIISIESALDANANLVELTSIEQKIITPLKSKIGALKLMLVLLGLNELDGKIEKFKKLSIKLFEAIEQAKKLAVVEAEVKDLAKDVVSLARKSFSLEENLEEMIQEVETTIDQKRESSSSKAVFKEESLAQMEERFNHQYSLLNLDAQRTQGLEVTKLAWDKFKAASFAIKQKELSLSEAERETPFTSARKEIQVKVLAKFLREEANRFQDIFESCEHAVSSIEQAIMSEDLENALKEIASYKKISKAAPIILQEEIEDLFAGYLDLDPSALLENKKIQKKSNELNIMIGNLNLRVWAMYPAYEHNNRSPLAIFANKELAGVHILMQLKEHIEQAQRVCSIVHKTFSHPSSLERVRAGLEKRQKEILASFGNRFGSEELKELSTQKQMAKALSQWQNSMSELNRLLALRRRQFFILKMKKKAKEFGEAVLTISVLALVSTLILVLSGGLAVLAALPATNAFYAALAVAATYLQGISLAAAIATSTAGITAGLLASWLGIKNIYQHWKWVVVAVVLASVVVLSGGLASLALLPVTNIFYAGLSAAAAFLSSFSLPATAGLTAAAFSVLAIGVAKTVNFVKAVGMRNILAAVSLIVLPTAAAWLFIATGGLAYLAALPATNVLFALLASAASYLAGLSFATAVAATAASLLASILITFGTAVLVGKAANSLIKRIGLFPIFAVGLSVAVATGIVMADGLGLLSSLPASNTFYSALAATASYLSGLPLPVAILGTTFGIGLVVSAFAAITTLVVVGVGMVLSKKSAPSSLIPAGDSSQPFIAHESVDALAQRSLEINAALEQQQAETQALSQPEVTAKPPVVNNTSSASIIQTPSPAAVDGSEYMVMKKLRSLLPWSEAGSEVQVASASVPAPALSVPVPKLSAASMYHARRPDVIRVDEPRASQGLESR